MRRGTSPGTTGRGVFLVVFLLASGPCAAWAQIDDTAGADGEAKLSSLISSIEELYREDPDRALDYSREGRPLLSEFGTLQLRRDHAFWTSRAFEYAGKYDSSFVFAQQLERLAQGDSRTSGDASYLLGRVYYLRGDYDTARAEYEEALGQYEAAGFRTGVGRTLNDIGVTYRDQSNNDAALTYYERSRDVRSELGDSAGVASSLSQIGFIHEDRGDYDSAIEYYERALEIRMAIGDRRSIASSYNNIAGIHFIRGDLESARDLFEKSLAVYVAVKDRRREAILSGNLGIVEKSLGHLDEALQHYMHSLELREQIGDGPGVAVALNSVGGIHADRGDFDQAISFFHRSLELRDETDTRGRATVYTNLGNVLMQAGRVAQAEPFFTQALALRQEIGDKRGEASTLNSLGELYLATGRYDEADQVLHQSLVLREEIGDRDGMASVLLTLGAAYQAQGRLDEALEQTDRVVAIADSTHSLLRLRDAHEQRASILEALGRYGEALSAHRLFKAANDSIFNSESESVMAELEASYRTEQQRQQIELLESNRVKQRLWLALLLVGVGLLVIVILLQFARIRLRKRALAAITEAREETEEKARELEKANELKSRFLANISHEFRTPLTLTFGPIDDLLSGRHAVDPDAIPNLQRARRNGGRLLRLINQLLDLSKLDAGALLLRPDRRDLAQHLRQIAALFDSFAESRDIRFSKNLPQGPTPHVYDDDKLEKIVTNLLSNAFKFTERHGTVSLQMEKTEDGSVQIEVADTGPGIAPEHLGHLFDRFYQVERSLTRSHEGSGIGLALVKELVELHRGSIDVASTVGVGTTFTVFLPELEPMPSEPEAAGDEGSSIVDESFLPEPLESVPKVATMDSDGEDVDDTPVILLIEDNPDMRAFIRERLEELYEVAEAENGRVGVELATEIVPDLIVSDVMMPEMGGLEATARIKADDRTSHIPVVLLTARSEVEDRIEGFESGADAYFPKPFNTQELMVRVRTLIDERRRLRALWNRSGDTPKTLDGESEDAKVSLPPREARFVENVQALITDWIGNSQLSVDRLAEEMHLSTRQLMRKLQALTGETPANMIRRMRMEEAARLIAAGDLSIKEVSARVGYRSTPSFTRAFREVHGEAPSSFIPS